MRKLKELLTQGSVKAGSYVTIEMIELKKIISTSQGDVYVKGGKVSSSGVNDYMKKVKTFLNQGGNRCYVIKIHDKIAQVKPNVNSSNSQVLWIPTKVLMEV